MALVGILALSLWLIAWKLYAAYVAIKRGQVGWVFAIFLINTMGILEIYYIFKVAKKSWVDVKRDFRKVFSRNK